ncbi:KR domain-containing protein, partial [Salmonella enterica]|uniref:KR domain-containing protein n=1 Tax=Salmonella enterica TaxID=28901 RepID=UPI003CE868CE
MHQVVTETTERFGPVNGAIHAAGIIGAQTILEKSDVQVQQVLDAKVRGALVLEAALNGHHLDFLCYFSSIAA